MNRQEAIDTLAKHFQQKHENAIRNATLRFNGTATIADNQVFADFQRMAEEQIDSEIYTSAIFAILDKC